MAPYYEHDVERVFFKFNVCQTFFILSRLYVFGVSKLQFRLFFTPKRFCPAVTRYYRVAAVTKTSR